MNDKEQYQAAARKETYLKAVRALDEVIKVCFSDLSDMERISIEAAKVGLLRKATRGMTASEIAAQDFKAGVK